MNYVRSNSHIGTYCYGFKLRTEDSNSNSSRLFRGFSERSNLTAPYFEVTYVTNSSYEMAYTPEKYNNISSNNINYNTPMYNFQNRMNCYAYALQVYYQSNNPLDEYNLVPGEFGINSNNYIQTNLTGEFSNIQNIPLYNYDKLQDVYDAIDNKIRKLSLYGKPMIYQNLVIFRGGIPMRYITILLTYFQGHNNTLKAKSWFSEKEEYK